MSDQPKTTAWKPMGEYPRDHDPGADTYWGPTVLVRVPAGKEYPHGPTHYIAHLEAGMWVTRAGSDPITWEELHEIPEVWMPIEGVCDVG